MRFEVESKSYGNHAVLRDVKFMLSPGHTLAVTGPSGIGKSTLLRIIAGLDADFIGTIPGNLKTGMVFQEPRLMPWLTAKQNVALIAEPANWLERVGLQSFAEHYPRQLSLGMQRRVAIARALAHQPDVLILDEPFASLDKATAKEMKALLKSVLLRTNARTLLVTHDEQDAVELAHSTIRLAGNPATIVETRL